ncbi:hypothetical protein JHK82_040275 [Glycine max]|nr:hypothetical protein JHK82_040275 [Glycine max]
MIRSCAWLSCVFSYRDPKQEQEHAQEVRCSRDCYSHGKCLADLCGALHCDAVMNFKSSRSKCNPVAAARNRRLCESLADNCFPISEGPSAGCLHVFGLFLFTKSLGKKKKPYWHQDQSSFFRLAAGALILVLLPVFQLFLYLVQRVEPKSFVGSEKLDANQNHHDW